MLGLHRRWRPVLLVRRCLLCLGRTGSNAAGAAVVADMVHPRVVDHGFVVNIANVRAAYIIYRAVVAEGPMIPISAFIAGTTITEAVSHAAIKAHMIAPVAVMPSVGIVAPAPITGSPEQANFRSHDPRTRHPEVALVTISPVAGRPQKTVAGDHGLGVHRERRRCDRDRNSELRERGGR